MQDLDLKIDRSTFNLIWKSLHAREDSLLKIVEEFGEDSDEGADSLNDIIALRLYKKELKELANGVPQRIIDEFTRISPIAWTHALFTGRYSFKKSGGNIDVEAMAKILEDHVKQHFWRDDEHES